MAAQWVFFATLLIVPLVSSANSYLQSLQKPSIAKLGAQNVQNGLLLASAAPAARAAGRSEILDVIRLDEKMGAYSYAKAKLTKEQSRYGREESTYKRLSGGSKDSFVQFYSSSPGLFVMEYGLADLRRFVDARGPLRGAELQYAFRAMTAAISLLHSRGLVWTDLKLENFILVPKSRTDVAGSLGLAQEYSSSAYKGFQDSVAAAVKTLPLQKFHIKLIDYESCVKNGASLVDFSVSTLAPEFLDIIANGQLNSVAGRPSDFKLLTDEALVASFKLDVWALGVSMLHLHGGKDVYGAFSGGDVRAAVNTLTAYSEGRTDLGLGGVQQPLRKLLEAMLQIDPRKRVSITGVQLSSFFLF